MRVDQEAIETLLLLKNRCEAAETLFSEQAESLFNRLEAGAGVAPGVHDAKIETHWAGGEQCQTLKVDGSAVYAWRRRGRRMIATERGGGEFD